MKEIKVSNNKEMTAWGLGTAPSKDEAAEAWRLEPGMESEGCGGEQDAAHLEVEAVFGEHARLGKPYQTTSNHASRKTRVIAQRLWTGSGQD